MIRRAFTVYYDDDSGELTRLDEGVTFQAESALMRADVLRDALGTLDALYKRAKSDAFHRPAVMALGKGVM